MNHPWQFRRRRRRCIVRLPLTAAVCVALASPAAVAQALANDSSASVQVQSASKAETQAGGRHAPQTEKKAKAQTLQTIIVTSEQRTQNLQKVPASINVLRGFELTRLHAQSFEDYQAYLPSVSFQEGGGGAATGPGFGSITMRGVTAGGNINHSGSLPTVAVYLDNLPVTTIEGPVDLHMYDISRVESLQGPQGTLYGASAEAGALRVITNQPDPSGFAANYTVIGDKVQYGDLGYTYEGMLNIPFANHRAAVRLVGWREHDAGYIDNAPGTRTYPSSGITISNKPNCAPGPLLQCIGRAQKNFNDVSTTGARAALKIDLGDNWSITPILTGQKTRTNGNFASDTSVGKLDVTQFFPDGTMDSWWMAGLTLNGKIGTFDVSYSYAHMKRNVHYQADYTDYSFWYDTLFSYGEGLVGNDGAMINPSMDLVDRNNYSNGSNSLRITSPDDDRLRFVGGAFTRQMKHEIIQNYRVFGLADPLTVTGWPNTEFLTVEDRYISSKAVFGQASYDLIPDKKLTLTLGERYYRTTGHLLGFYGYSKAFLPDSTFGEAGCMSPEPFRDAPCTDFDASTKNSGSLHLERLTWNVTPNVMLYVLHSEGFRPGGVNRFANAGPYQPDFLKNSEAGWKTTWLGDTLRFNGAIFRDNWDNFQFNVLGPHAITIIENANAARIDGLETQVQWAPTHHLSVGLNAAFYKPKLTANYCGFTGADGRPVTDCPAGTINPETGEPVSGPEAPAGTRLPITPHFKGNVIARYTFDAIGRPAYVQAAWVHVGQRTTDLRTQISQILGDLPAYNNVDFSAGMRFGSVSVGVFLKNAFDTRGALYKYTECDPQNCGAHGVVPQYPDGQVYTNFTQPRTIGIQVSEDFF